jgi:hypothetical protein
MIKTNSLKQDVSVIDAFRVLVIVSDFELRISVFLNENLVFVQEIAIQPPHQIRLYYFINRVSVFCKPDQTAPGERKKAVAETIIQPTAFV